MRIVFNPEEGALIKDVMYKDELLFSEKEGEQFEPGMVVQCEDDVADFLVGERYINKLHEEVTVKQGLFQFLRIMEPTEAKKYLADTKSQLKCIEEDCDFTTRLQSKLSEHEKVHKKEKMVSELGIPLVGSAKRKAANFPEDEEKIKSRERAWDSQDKNMGDGFPGLEEGEGLRDDRPQKTAIMS